VISNPIAGNLRQDGKGIVCSGDLINFRSSGFIGSRRTTTADHEEERRKPGRSRVKARERGRLPGSLPLV